MLEISKVKLEYDEKGPPINYDPIRSKKKFSPKRPEINLQ
jgi:hypothetical protein